MVAGFHFWRQMFRRIIGDIFLPDINRTIDDAIDESLENDGIC